MIKKLFTEELLQSNKVIPEKELINTIYGIRIEVFDKNKNNFEDALSLAIVRSIIAKKLSELLQQ